MRKLSMYAVVFMLMFAVSSVGFIDGDIQKLGLVFDNDDEWTVQMYFDYFYHDNARHQVVTAHPYTDMTPTFVEL